jgi:rare lipoprotein A
MQYKRVIVCFLLLALCACGGQPQKPPYAGIKIGKPYEVYGRWYEPGYSAHYDEIGMASWYGPGFHGGHTASGERFDQNAMTAAHRTLPLPSIVRVTNLDNGMSVLVKVNDRGPFAHDRIIDLSRAAALRLGVFRTGTAKVRVQFLDKETREYVRNLETGTQYAMGELKSVNPEAAGLREEDSARPAFKVESRMFADNAPTPGGELPATPVESENLPPPGAQVPPAPGADNSVFDVVDDKAAMPPQRHISTPARAYERPAAILRTGFVVQAGTFSEQQNAESLSNRLEGGEQVQVMEVLVSGKKFYRVMIGPYQAREDARNMLSKLASIGISDAKIIRN